MIFRMTLCDTEGFEASLQNAITFDKLPPGISHAQRQVVYATRRRLIEEFMARYMDWEGITLECDTDAITIKVLSI